MADEATRTVEFVADCHTLVTPHRGLAAEYVKEDGMGGLVRQGVGGEFSGRGEDGNISGLFVAEADPRERLVGPVRFHEE
jgi:hypothetical protein